MSKAFKTIVVEHLEKEENEDVVNILNQIIEQGIVGSGSKALMYAVRQYPHNIKTIADLQFTLEETKAELDRYYQNVQKLKDVFSFVYCLDNQLLDARLRDLNDN